MSLPAHGQSYGYQVVVNLCGFTTLGTSEGLSFMIFWCHSIQAVEGHNKLELKKRE